MSDIVLALPDWAIYAIVGAFLGGIGGLVGSLLERAGIRFARYVAVVAVALTPAITREFVLPRIATDKALADSALMQVIGEEVPQDIDHVKEQFRIVNQTAKSNIEAKERAFKTTAELRRKYANELKKAPDSFLLPLLKSNLTILKAIRDQESEQSCSEFAAGRVPEQANNHLVLIEETAVALFRAIGAALRNPENVSTATEADWAEIVMHFNAKGGTDEQLRLIGEQASSSPSYCDAIILFYEAVMAAPKPAGHRVRAELAQAIAAY